MATHSSILDGIIPWKKEPCRLQSMWLQRAKHNSRLVQALLPKGGGKKPNQTCLFLSKNGTFPGSTEISACFLKSSDATNRHKGLFHKYQERDLAIQAGNLDMSVCQKPNLNPTSFVINGFYIVVPDSWLKFWNGNCEVPVFVCVYMCYRCVVLPQLICKKGVFNWLKGN